MVEHSAQRARLSDARKERRRRDLRSAHGGRGTYAFFLVLEFVPLFDHGFAEPGLYSLPESDFKLGRASSLRGPARWNDNRSRETNAGASVAAALTPFFLSFFSFRFRPLFNPGFADPGLHSLPESELELGRASSPRALAPLNNDRLS